MALALAALAALVILGPRAGVEEGAVAPVVIPGDVEAYLHAREEGVPGLREGEGKTVIWADPEGRSSTGLAVVYLHGFSADRHELSPVPERVADSLGANLFLTRLTGHGQDGPALGAATAADWLQDAEEALTVGRRLGRRMVLMGTSTGGTLAVWAASQERWRGTVAALILVSPNFGPRDPFAGILLWPWGGLLASLAEGPERCFTPLNPGQEHHWTTCYPTRALLPMMALVERVRSSDLGLVEAPVLVLSSPQDAVVDARATERLLPRFGSRRKERVTLEGDDPSHHVLAGDIVSPGSTDRAVAEILRFLRSLSAPGTPP